MNISSQDFRNQYERFYVPMRMYLWPYEVLKNLAAVETEIYQAFIDIDALSKYFNKLKSDVREVYKDDKNFRIEFDKLDKLVNTEEPQFYARLTEVGEVNPENNKQLRTIPREDEEDEI